MLIFDNVSKVFRGAGAPHWVLKDTTIALPTDRPIGLLGRNGVGKSTMLKMIAGTQRPTRGEITTQARVSWPVGFAGAFHNDLTGAQNIRFVARLYSVDPAEALDFVSDFAALGPHMHKPFRTYSSGMRARLAFGVSMAINFDLYLVDEVTAVGDATFRAKSAAYLKDRLQHAGAIVVSHSLGLLRDLCDMGLVLDQGALTVHDSIDDALAHHLEVMAAAA